MSELLHPPHVATSGPLLDRGAHTGDMTVNEKTNLGNRPLKALRVSWACLNSGVHGVPPLDLQVPSPRRKQKAEAQPSLTVHVEAPAHAELNSERYELFCFHKMTSISGTSTVNTECKMLIC